MTEDTKEDLIIDMLLTLCGRNLEIDFSETQTFSRRYEAIKTKEADGL